jgi:hypothetical protein
MGYFVEYSIPSADKGEEFEFPVSEKHSGYTIPLTETDAEVVHAPELPARSRVLGATLAEAQEAAEQVINHSRATEALLFEDPDNSTVAGSGTLVCKYSQNQGWARP